MKRALAGVFFVAALFFLLAYLHNEKSAPLTQEQQRRDDELANDIAHHTHGHKIDADEIAHEAVKRAVEGAVRDAVRVR
jgi:hypothetical protein